MLRKALPIRYILLAAFLLAGLLPTTLITGLAFYEARIALKTEIQHDMQTRAIATADEIDRMMFERLQNVASWSELEVMQDIRIDDIDKRVSRFLVELKSSYRDVYVNLDVVNNKGIIVASSNPLRIGLVSPALRTWLHTSLSHHYLRVGKLQNQQLPIVVDIPDNIQDGVVGTLVAYFDWRQINQVLENAVFGRSAAALFDKDGQLLANTQRWQKTGVSRKLQASAVANGYQGFGGFFWRVDILQNRSQALTPVRHMAYIFTGLLLATFVLVILIAGPIATSITQPLARLTEFASRFVRSPSAAPPPTGGPAEIQEMSQAFGKMIADLEQSKENLTRAAKLAVVGEMAAAMSHEVRTPLGILRSSAQVLLREPGLSAEGREVCGFIISETERLNKLVSTLMESAKPNLPEFKAVNLNELALQSAAMLKTQAEKKRIQVECIESAPVLAACDAEQMTQVFLNLLLNAIQVLSEDGHIRITVSTVPGYAVIVIEDDGPGIPEDQRKTVFDPFFTQRPGGIGLGLAVVRQIVLAHHGEISVHQSSMRGAEFRVQLPLEHIQTEQA